MFIQNIVDECSKICSITIIELERDCGCCRAYVICFLIWLQNNIFSIKNYINVRLLIHFRSEYLIDL